MTAVVLTRVRPVRESMDASAWALVGLFGVLFSLALQPAIDPDLGWHLGTGRWITENRRIPLTDPFSWSVPGRRWIAHEWLTEVVMHAIRSVGGDTLLIVVWAALITAAWGLLHRSARLAGATRGWAGSLTAIGAVSTIHTWGVRPQMLTLALTAYVGMRLHRWRGTDRTGSVPWDLIPVVALWVNLHGGYIFGIVMVIVFACGATGERVIARTRPLGASAPSTRSLIQVWGLVIGCVAASLCSPNTIDGLIYPFTYLGDNASTRYVGEWFRPDYTDPQFWPFAALLVAALPVMFVGLRLRIIGLTEIGLVVPFAFLGAQSMRNISQYVVCCIPVFAAVGSSITARRRTERSLRSQSARRSRNSFDPQLRKVMVAAISSITVVSSVAFTRTTINAKGNNTARAVLYPITASRWLAENPGGTVFNHYNYGGWLVLQQVPVFVDGRPDMYGDAFMDDYVRVTAKSAAPQWQQSLRRLGATRVLMPKNSAMAQQIASDIAAGNAPSWTEPAKDPIARLFVTR